ncbi:hypothetical protein I8748_16140 [Nostoc sp. CENA67]|uniref:Uncharacterized protein n=1 Tax=Amazonocrinis nigriterrae CENA67 TaxID=2794033 RepID=A0A8J7HU07_9NOST|nr:hypothetical protein [Amazonocrinis nigriterrae]MBH8563703.1 hypothetical protein [Amazonocrinis nigriterrae CENA67]
MVSKQANSHQHHLKYCLGMLVALLAWPQPEATAQSLNLPEPTQIYQLSTPQQVVVPPQQLGEIVPAPVSETVRTQQGLLARPQFNTLITRELPGLWQMRVPVDQVGSLYATYEIKAGNGQSNRFSSDERSEQTVRVAVEPLPIIEISRDENTNTALVQGGVRLQFDLANAGVAGGYVGVLNVTVNQR